MDDLKLCPVCGEMGVLVEHRLIIGGTKYRVVCWGCLNMTNRRRTKEEAVREWNGKESEVQDEAD